MKLITLNIEGSYHLSRCIPFLKKEKADIVCLQEVFEKDFERIKEELGMKGSFIPIIDKTEKGCTYQAEGIEGIAFFTRLENDGIKTHFYVGKGKIPKYEDAETHDRAVVYTTVKSDEKTYNIATTHFTWSESGKTTDKQRKDFKELIKFLKRFSSLILCGDFNAPRGGEIYESFKKYYKDNLPTEVKTTIDQNLHRKKGIMLAVDTIFTTPDVKVSELKIIEGVSDHKAIIGII